MRLAKDRLLATLPRMFDYDTYRGHMRGLGDYPEKPLNQRLAILVVAIPPGCTVLDVACGTGRVLRAISAKGCHGRGIDLSPPAVRAAQSAGLDVMEGDVDAFEESPLVQELLFGRYDVVVFSKCLMYLRCKNEIMRRLDTDAILIFQDNPHYWRRLVTRCCRGGAPEAKGLEYRLANGEEIAIDSPAALAHWGASYGYAQFHKLYGGIRRKSIIVKTSRVLVRGD